MPQKASFVGVLVGCAREQNGVVNEWEGEREPASEMRVVFTVVAIVPTAFESDSASRAHRPATTTAPTRYPLPLLSIHCCTTTTALQGTVLVARR